MMTRGGLVALAALLILGHPARAAADGPGAKEALVLLRILAYDRYVGKRARSRVVIGVVRDDGDPVSRRAGTIMAAALRSAAHGITVAGKPVVIVEIASGELFRDRLRDLEVTALYLTPGLDSELVELSAAARAQPCLTFTDRLAYLTRGAAVALGHDHHRNRITISLDLVEVRAQGAQLSAELLHVARVVRR